MNNGWVTVYMYRENHKTCYVYKYLSNSLNIIMYLWFFGLLVLAWVVVVRPDDRLVGHHLAPVRLLALR